MKTIKALELRPGMTILEGRNDRITVRDITACGIHNVKVHVNRLYCYDRGAMVTVNE